MIIFTAKRGKKEEARNDTKLIKRCLSMSVFIDEKCLIQFAIQKEDPVKHLPTHWENIGNVMIW